MQKTRSKSPDILKFNSDATKIRGQTFKLRNDQVVFDVHSKMHYVDVSDEEAAEKQKIFSETFMEYF